MGDVYRYGLRLGLDLVRRGEARLALPYLIRPVNYWRAAEYRQLFSAVAFRPGDRVLDIGSSKLLAVYLAERHGVDAYATDIEDYFVDRLTRIRAIRGLPADRLRIGIEDGRALSFPDGTFDCVYSISVLQHIPEDGDSRCLAEIGRVLRPGGVGFFSVPFSPVGREEYRPPDFYWAGSSVRKGDLVFYLRRYGEDDLHRRLVEPSGLRIRTLAFFGERVLTRSKLEVEHVLPVVAGPVAPLLSRLLHTGPAASWRGLAKPVCAMLVLEKPR